MAHFMVRVELHQPYTRETYDQLHEVMRQSNFLRIIQASDRAFYWLPPAEYSHYSVNENPFQILDQAAAVVNRVHRDFEIFVAKTEAWAARGLKPTH